MFTRLRRKLHWKHGLIGGGALGSVVVGAVLLLPGCLPPEMKQASDAVAHLNRQSYPVSISDRQLEVRYLATGDPNGPRVLLIHGTPGEAENWGFLLADPPPGVEVVAVDRPGFGQTTPKREVVRLEDQAAALAPLLVDRQGKKTIVVGHSYGGPVAAQLAVDYPDRVGGLVMAAAALDPDLERILWYQHVGEWLSWAIPDDLKHTNREIFALEDELRGLAPRLAEITTPIEIIHGTDDELVPYENVPYMSAGFTGPERLRVTRLEGANHFLPWLHTPALREAIDRLLESPGEAEADPEAAP
ncbi:MAG: alpha/beta fold hydrolase [Planctomycetota bacterium]